MKNHKSLSFRRKNEKLFFGGAKKYCSLITKRDRPEGSRASGQKKDLTILPTEGSWEEEQTMNERARTLPT